GNMEGLFGHGYDSHIFLLAFDNIRRYPTENFLYLSLVTSARSESLIDNPHVKHINMQLAITMFIIHTLGAITYTWLFLRPFFGNHKLIWL
ncbi:hypothetical protein ACJX0J_009671, partial [Zea mays]